MHCNFKSLLKIFQGYSGDIEAMIDEFITFFAAGLLFSFKFVLNTIYTSRFFMTLLPHGILTKRL